MKDLNQITKDWLLERRADIVNQQKQKRMVASGKSAASLGVEEKGTAINLMGSPSFRYQEEGRGPTNRKGRIPLYVIIRQWMKDKGLNSTKSFNEYSIANKIHATGTRIFRKEVKGLEIDEIITKHIPKLENNLGLFLRDRVQSDILNRFKNGNFN